MITEVFKHGSGILPDIFARPYKSSTVNIMINFHHSGLTRLRVKFNGFLLISGVHHNFAV